MNLLKLYRFRCSRACFALLQGDLVPRCVSAAAGNGFMLASRFVTEYPPTEQAPSTFRP